jgi:hypothetical protein
MFAELERRGTRFDVQEKQVEEVTRA